MNRVSLSCLSCLVLLACSDSDSPGTTQVPSQEAGVDSSAGSGGTAGTSGNAGSAGSTAGGAGNAGTGTGGSAGSTTGGSAGVAGAAGNTTGGSAGAAGAAGSGNICPHVDLGSTLPATYSGDTTSLTNIAESTRLEWKEAPEDTLLFTAPSAGKYRISMTEPSTNSGCGASMQEYAWAQTTQYYDESWCPAPGSVKNLDGVYAAGDGITTDFDLAQGQKVMIWVSCTSWATPQSGPYTLKIEKL